MDLGQSDFDVVFSNISVFVIDDFSSSVLSSGSHLLGRMSKISG